MTTQSAPDRRRRSRDHLPRVVDAAAGAAVVGVFWAPGLVAGAPGPRAWVGAALAGVLLVAVVGRWRSPGIATAAAAAATFGGALVGVGADPMLATAWCLHALAVERAARTRVLTLLLMGGGTVLALVTAVPQQVGQGQRAVLAVAALGVAWLLGTSEGRRLEAAREAERARGAERETRTQLAVAREVHDVVGHALAVIGAEAGVSRALPDAGEDELRRSLADVERHARSALTEVQALVRSLRVPDGEGRAPDGGGWVPDGEGRAPDGGGWAPDGGGREPDEGGPAPQLSRLAELIAAVRAAGVRVEARLDVAGPVGQPVSAAAFRITQEALSNVVRHAPGASCAVDVRVEGGAVVTRVHDDGPGLAEGVAPGSGLRGMRERAASVGGDVVWRNRDGGGFEVEARLPVGGAP
ncbi:sensor histidine kinase [Actinosynnema sp. NPDC059797]